MKKNAKNFFFLGFLSLSNLKMKVMLTVLALFILWTGRSFCYLFDDSGMKKSGLVLYCIMICKWYSNNLIASLASNNLYCNMSCFAKCYNIWVSVYCTMGWKWHSCINSLFYHMSCFAKWFNKVLLFNIKASSSLKHYSPRLFNIPQHRSFSTSSSSEASPQPIKVYLNADTDKLKFLQDNVGKSGIYRWTNLKNGKSYIGSSINLYLRMREYYSVGYLETKLRKSKSKIFSSLLKNGYYSFSLEILEYCEKDQTFFREQYYLDLLNSEYNILKTAVQG